MFMTKTLYIGIMRERTNETVILSVKRALEIINNYDEKQQFMNLLGQENFWKKNRLDLWAALKDDAITDEAFALIPANAKTYLSRVAFQNTPVMLPEIKHRITTEVEHNLQLRRKIPTENWNYNDRCFHYHAGKRKVLTRAVQANINQAYIRLEDVEAFNRDLNKLLDKYVVKAPERLTNGVQRFNANTVAQRYVERVYNFDRYDDPYNW